MLHLTKVAVGCASLDVLRSHMDRHDTPVATVTTRYKPTRADELIGGSLYWIIKHRLIARQTILGFDSAEEGKRCLIRLDRKLVPVRGHPRRAHQGWRYLAGADAPADFDASDGDLATLPPRMAEELAALALI